MNENKPRRRAQAARAAKKSAYRKSGLSRLVLMVTMMALVAAVSIGGTLAWLQASTTEVVNTFAAKGITLELEETDAVLTDGKYTKDYDIIPGTTLAKDPKVTASCDTDYFVFVKLTKSADWKDTVLTYEIADGWTELTGATLAEGEKVYYKDLTSADKLEDVSVLKNDQVLVPYTVTASDMEGINPTLTVKAYAIQKINGTGTDGVNTTFTALEAWTEVSK